MSNDSTSHDQPQLWQPWIGILYGIVVFFFMQVAAGVILYAYPSIKGWDQNQTQAWLASSIVPQAIYLALVDAFIIGALVVFLKRYKGGFRAIGIRKPRGSDLLYGIAAVLPYFILYAITLTITTKLFTGIDVDQKQELGFDHVTGGFQLGITFVCLVVLAPIMEEILVRGLLYRSFKWALPVVPAAIATSMLFGAAHLGEGGAAGPLYVAAIDTFVLSLVLIYLREKTGALWSSMVLHAIKNGIAFTALFALHLT